MADFKGRKRGKSHVQKHGDFFLVAQDMILSHRAKFQLIINFFRVCMYFVVFLPDYNYCPISLLSQLDKLFEKMIFCRISAFLEKYNLLNAGLEIDNKKV